MEKVKVGVRLNIKWNRCTRLFHFHTAVVVSCHVMPPACVRYPKERKGAGWTDRQTDVSEFHNGSSVPCGMMNCIYTIDNDDEAARRKECKYVDIEAAYLSV